MKKISFLLCLLLFLCGCRSQADYLKSYTVMNTDNKTDIQVMISPSSADGFSTDLAVVSVEDAQAGYNAQAYEDVDATEIMLTGTSDNEVITASGIYNEMPPASLTKILTALVALQSDLDFDKTYTLTDDVRVDVVGAQLCGYEAGDEITLRDLFYSMLIYSGNDAANAVASIVSGGDIPAFCDRMNETAASLGATHTHFVTPNGLDDPDHYSTAYDLYLIFCECLKYDMFKDAISYSGYTAEYIHGGNKVSQTWETTNYYLLGKKDPPEGIKIIGGKTGTTDNAGLCLILYVEDEDSGKGYISVLLGSPDKDVLYKSMSNLLANIKK